MVLGLGSWTVWEKWYYIHLIDDAAYKVTPCSPLHVIIVVAEHEPAGPADWAGGGGDWSPRLHRRPLPQQAAPGNGQSVLKYHHDYNTLHILQYTILILIVFMFEAVLGLISYVLQDRLQEDLGDLVKTSYFDKYQDDRLVRASVDQVQIQVNSKN